MISNSINNAASAVTALQAPLLRLAYTLTGERSEAYNLLRDTTRSVMSRPAGVIPSPESLFEVMREIYRASYSTRADKHRVEVATRRLYAIPAGEVSTDDTVPEGTMSASHATTLLTRVADPHHRRALSLRAVGYTYREIARLDGISAIRARFRVLMGGISLRAAARL